MFGTIFEKFRRRRGARAQKVFFDIDQFVDICNRSLVVKISVIVIVWAFCTMILTLSLNRQKDISKWGVDKNATRTIIAKAPFEYIDFGLKEKLQREAEGNTPDYFAINEDRTIQIKKSAEEFFNRIDQRSKGTLLDEASEISQKIGNASQDLITRVIERRSDGRTPSEWNDFFEKKRYSGIIGTEDKASRLSGKEIKIVHSDGKTVSKSIADCLDVVDFASEAANIWGFDREKEPALRREFVGLFSGAIGEFGNLDFDGAKTAQAKNRSREEIKDEDVKTLFPAGEKIVGRNDVITPTIASQLNSYRKMLPAEFKITYRDGAFNFLRSIVILAVVIFYLVSLKPAVMKDTKAITVMGVLIIISLIINYWTIKFFEYLALGNHLEMREFIAVGIPVELPMVLIAVLLGYRQALAAGFVVITISALMLIPEQFNQLQQVLRWLAIGGVCALCVVKVVSYRTFFLRVFFVSIFAKLLVSVDWTMVSRIKELINSGTENGGGAMLKLQQIITQDIWVLLGSGFACAVLALVLVFVFEIVFNFDTNMALTVLGNYNHPLLENLRRKAPGTLSHSQTVSTLAEDAAKAIGANSLRAQVSALFHDIGKTDHPEYYTENNPDSAALHDKLSPQLSSLVIREHVKNGIAIARQHHLFRYIRDAIATHHGDDLVRFFYEKAKKLCRKKGEPESSVREADFRYSGTPPRDKELVILSLADACEAASRSLPEPSEARIEKLVDDIIVSRLLGGQLRNGILTLEELYIVRDSFIKTLLSIYHGRIAYPEKNDEKTQLHVEESPSAGAKPKKS